MKKKVILDQNDRARLSIGLAAVILLLLVAGSAAFGYIGERAQEASLPATLIIVAIGAGLIWSFKNRTQENRNVRTATRHEFMNSLKNQADLTVLPGGNSSEPIDVSSRQTKPTDGGNDAA